MVDQAFADVLAIDTVIGLAVRLDGRRLGISPVNDPGDQIRTAHLTGPCRSRVFSDLNIKINLFHFISFFVILSVRSDLLAGLNF